MPNRFVRWLDVDVELARDGYALLPLFAQPMWLRFKGAAIDTLHGDDRGALQNRWVPLASIGDGETEGAFLAIDSHTPDCAVSMYWPDMQRWQFVAPTLDGLLNSMSVSPANVRVVELGDSIAAARLSVVKDAERVLERRPSKARTVELEEIVARMIALSTGLTDTVAEDDGRYHRLGSLFVFRRAQVEIALGRKREASQTLQFLEVDGAPTTNDITLFELLLELGEPDRIVELASSFDSKRAVSVGTALPAALLLTGAHDAAERLLVDQAIRRATAEVRLSLGKRQFDVALGKVLGAISTTLERRVSNTEVVTVLPALFERVAIAARTSHST